MSSFAGLNAVRLREVAEKDAGDERQRRGEPAERGSTERHRRSVPEPSPVATTLAYGAFVRNP